METSGSLRQEGYTEWEGKRWRDSEQVDKRGKKGKKLSDKSLATDGKLSFHPVTGGEEKQTVNVGV